MIKKLEKAGLKEEKALKGGKEKKNWLDQNKTLSSMESV